MATLIVPTSERALIRAGIVLTMCASMLSPSRAPIPPSIGELLELAPSQRAAYDPAELDILCARDLPGEQELDGSSCLAALDRWTACVRAATEKRIAAIASDGVLVQHRGSSPASQCKAQALVDVLRDSIGSNSKLASLAGGTLESAVAEGLILDPRDLFACGITDDSNRHRPTSVSLPWLYLAVGRRLGYPLRSAAQDGRLLLRWEGQDVQFNIDWEQSWAGKTPADSTLRFDVERPGLMPAGIALDQSPAAQGTPMHLLTADDELAMLLNARGACLESHGQNTEALVAYAEAHQLSPDCENYLVAIAHVMPKISSFFGHTEPMPAPDYSDRGGAVAEINAFNRYNLERQQEDDARLGQVLEENKRTLKARQDQRNSHP